MQFIRKSFFLLLFIKLLNPINGQIVFYQDVFYGGVTGGGFSTGVGDGGSGQIVVTIDPTSIIRKAYLICNRYGDASPVNITLNSISYNFNHSNQVSDNFLSFITNDTIICAVHAIDVTNDISPLINTYNIVLPSQLTDVFNKYGAFYLLILYENPVLQKTNVAVIFNNKDESNAVNYAINNLSPINNNNPVGLAIHSDIIWDTIIDGSHIYFNSNYLGLIGGSDNVNNFWVGSGVKGHFYYQNNSLFGLDDDVSNNIMGGTDGLADVSSYLPNNSTSVNINIITQSLILQYNIYLAFFLAYTSPCDTFSANVSYQCMGDTIQLQASGGIAYEWLPQQNLSCYNCPNPVFTGNKSTTYTCRIWSSDSCSKVLPLSIHIPKPDSIAIIPGTCGNNNSSVQLFNNTSPYPPLTYSLNNQTNQSGLFGQLDQGYYIYKISDSKACSFYDTLFISTNIKTKAIAKTSIDKENPFLYFFTSQSQHADYFKWIIQPPDTTIELENISYLFEQSGDYKICLEAYYKKTDCKDIHCFRLSVKDSAIVIAPNVFTPNGDNKNDVFALYIKGIKQAEINIYNRWGEPVHSKILSIENQTEYKKHIVIWDGIHTSTKSMCSSGVYYWTLNATDNNGNAVTKSGNVQLLE